MNLSTILISLSATFLLSTCADKKNSNSENDDVYILVSIKQGMTNSSDNNGELSMNQSYSFSDDGNFIKSQTSKRNTLELFGVGTYANEKTEEGISYYLNYKEHNGIVGSCSGNNQEELLLRKDGKLQNSWMMCDGPFLVYEKIE